MVEQIIGNDINKYIEALNRAGSGIICIDYMDGKKRDCIHVEPSKTKVLPEKNIIAVYAANGKCLERYGDTVNVSKLELGPVRIVIGERKLVIGTEEEVLNHFTEGLPKDREDEYKEKMREFLENFIK